MEQRTASTDVEQYLSDRILVVDDDPISTDISRMILRYAGYMVDVAHTPEQARQLLYDNQPDLVLMDVHLENANGIQFVDTIRKGSVCPDVPVIIVTSDAMRDTLASAVDVSIQGYFIKPYDGKSLVEKIQTVLRDRRRRAVASSGLGYLT